MVTLENHYNITYQVDFMKKSGNPSQSEFDYVLCRLNKTHCLGWRKITRRNLCHSLFQEGIYFVIYTDLPNNLRVVARQNRNNVGPGVGY